MFALTHMAIEQRYLAYKSPSVLMRVDTIRGNYIENIILSDAMSLEHEKL